MDAITDWLRPDSAILVTDFDGTLARPDFYQLVHERLVPSTTPDYWSAYRRGELTHFEALQSYFRAAGGGEAALLEICQSMRLPVELDRWLERLNHAGWQTVVVSAGCRWYIDRLLAAYGARLPLLANPGDIDSSGHLQMMLPAASPFSNLTTGVDKAGFVRHLLAEGRRVAFAGDGYPDQPAAVLVPDELRFARADLASCLDDLRLPYHRFDQWEEIAQYLLTDGG